MSRTRKILLGVFITLAVASAALAFAVYSLQGKIDQRLEKGWVLPPLEVYSQGIILSLGRKFPQTAIDQEFMSRELNSGRDYENADRDACSRMSGLTLKETSVNCLWLRREQVLVAWDEKGFIQEIWRGDPWVQVAAHALWPRLITQFFNEQPILQKTTALAEMPLLCLQAATAIEDRDFLEHKGISITGTLRAILRNIKAGRFAEGGSTITQQLVKNFFLTPKKTIKRKVSEQLLSVMLESQISKDQILEMYLNVIYMGQSGPYQILGFGSAADYYFGKPIGHLNLPECALLGAIINNPGKFSPFNKTDAAKNRRSQVLDKMADAQMITTEQANEAKNAPLPLAETKQRHTQAPYFVMTALKEFQALDLESAEEGARLYTTLDPELQTVMSAAIAKLMPSVEAKVKKPSKQPLQVAAITVDLATAQVVALTGGRDFRGSQFNRAYDSKRQIGSIVKPYVYLAALMEERDPTTEIVDEPFEWKSGKNVWKPRNYDKKNYGTIPYFFALAQSLNIPAAKIGQEVGLEKIADLIADSGIRAKVPLLPSLTLGAFEINLWEVAQGYTTFGRFGRGDRIHTLLRVENLKNEILFEREPASDVELDSQATAVLTGMMRQTFEVGSARAARAWGVEGAYAGKTGTTSDTKDAWFAGFNPQTLTVVWVGYDDNTAMGLTGASAALPVWTEVTKAYHQLMPPPPEFGWPEGVEVRELSGSEITDKYPTLIDMPEKLRLTFADWAY